MRGLGRLSAAAFTVCALALPVEAGAFDPALEAKNFAKVSERQAYVTGTPAFQTRLQQQNVEDVGVIEQIILNDPDRNPLGNICANRKNECAGDVRFYDWEENGYGVVTPVLFTGRSGANISGNVWTTAAGPAQRPAIVMTTGSVQAPETLYWGLAAVYAKAGYVVLTYDVQGQGRSDTFGKGPDQQEGVPSQAGQPFYDGTEDALDFMLSAPGQPYDPRPSCGNANGGTGTDHSPEHDARVAQGLTTAFNPAHSLVDATRVGITGHSLGAAAVSHVGQVDPRVDTVVAYDNLRFPADGADADARPDGVPTCPSATTTRDVVPANTKPALGISNDYGLTPTPFTSDPGLEDKNSAFTAFSTGPNTDTMQVNIRGGSHYESSLIPGNTVPVLGTGTWRGEDLVAWYTLGWLDKYLKADPAADTRLLSDRWCDDDLTQGVDLNNDGNMFSFYFRSRHDFALSAGGNAVSADMRAGCPANPSDPEYDFVAAANTADAGGPAGPDGDGDGVPDLEDSCPSVAGTGGDGCPPQPSSAQQDGPAQPLPLVQRNPGCDPATPLRGTRRGDKLTGTASSELILGKRGRDRLNGRGGSDCIFGGPGRDRIKARDGERDEVNCGGGRDRVRADAIDSLRRCERRR